MPNEPIYSIVIPGTGISVLIYRDSAGRVYYLLNGEQRTYSSQSELIDAFTQTTDNTTNRPSSRTRSSTPDTHNQDQQIREIFGQWMGRMPTTAELNTAKNSAWGELTYIWYAVNHGGSGPLLTQAYDRIRQIAAPFYGGDPSAIPQSLLETLTEQGLFADETYLRDTYFPKLRGADLTNPLAAGYIDAWVELTGKSMTDGAIDQLDQFIRAYGYTDIAQEAWLQWAKTTNAAITGNYGASKRGQISAMVAGVLGREPTDEELDSAGSYWELNEDAMLEKLRGTDEYQSIYDGKPASMSEAEWVSQAKAIDAVMRWYYGDNAVLNDDGTITIGGVTGEGGTTGGMTNFGIKYLSNAMLGTLISQGYTAEQLQRDFGWAEDAIQNAALYDEMLTEAFGQGFSPDEWQAFASGGLGSGELKAKLLEAQNRVGYREAYRQVFGVDPDPTDYERIMGEFVSPNELLGEYQAQYSADEMYDEVNEMLMHVYGEGVTREELKDMALKREGTGELKALINQATKLYEYRELHKQYYGEEATPEDYAKYAGYTSPAELQWDIVATETAAENQAIIKEAWGVAFPDEPMITDEDIYKMYAGQEGYGETKAKVGEAKEMLQKQEQGRDWAYTGAERASIGYQAAQGGGFKQSVTGLGEL